MAKKRKKTRFVPPMILGTAVLAGVVPAIAVTGVTACSDGSQQFAVGNFVAASFDASVAASFDAGPDANGFVVAASFDAGPDAPDANGFSVGASFDAGPDANGFTVAANFDASPDANGFVVAATFDASSDADGNGGHDSGEG